MRLEFLALLFLCVPRSPFPKASGSVLCDHSLFREFSYTATPPGDGAAHIPRSGLQLYLPDGLKEDFHGCCLLGVRSLHPTSQDLRRRQQLFSRSLDRSASSSLMLECASERRGEILSANFPLTWRQ